MAEGLVSALLEQLVSVVFEHTKEAVTLVLNAKKDVKKFSRHLTTIQAALEDAEQQQVMKASVRDWLDRLKDVSYEMDNLLDEWNTEILKQQVEKQLKEGEMNAVVTKKKVRFSVVSNLCCFGQVNKAIYYHKIASGIKDLNQDLALIVSETEEFGFLQSSVSTQENLNQPLQTSSFIDRSTIIGRKEVTSNLLSKLLGESGQEEKELRLIPIVGMGGIGKTTLAQLAYNNENVEKHFGKRIWVCVSDPFEELKIAKAIITGSGSNKTPNSDEMQDVLQCMSDSLKGNKVLIVLDDVWTEDRGKWANLKLPVIMQSCAKGSRLLVTTRSEGVARMMRATTHMIQVKKLSHEKCLALFNNIAYLGREEYEADRFRAIGEKIVRKCDGLPLAAVCLGALMQYKKTMGEWLEVLDSKIWDEVVVDQVFRPLLLSYYGLGPVVKRCLLYGAIFPKDYRFNKHTLIELWMSQDYLSGKDYKEKEKRGQHVFDTLVMRSFFQDVEVGERSRYDEQITTFCKMHDIVHDLVQFLNKNECFTIEPVKTNAIITKLTEEVRHLTLLFAPFDSPLSDLISAVNCKKLRTLATFDSSISCIESKDISQLKCVRTLILSSNDIKELPEEMGELVHLRYVDLSENKSLEKLPNSLCNLYNLRTLRLVRCKELKKLPENMGSLISLTHLHLEGSGVKYLPIGIGRLTSLQTLDVCSVYASDIVEVFGRLDRLQGSLTINILGDRENSSDAEEEKEYMCNKEKLLHLTLNFQDVDEEDDSGQRRRSSNAETVLRGLRPHENLATLSISGWKGITWPSWFKRLENLRFLSLTSCGECEHLPALGKLPILEEITIEGMLKVKTVGDEFLGIAETSSQQSSSTPSSSSCILFPKLEKLHFGNMDKLEHWEGVGGLEENSSEITMMPRLSSLQIHYCMELRNLPAFLRNRSALAIDLINCDTLRSDDLPAYCEIVRLGDEYYDEDDKETYFFQTTYSRLRGNTSTRILGHIW
ncbi:PREDICTED: putative disease resistance protein RGA4 [Fragaria vesca subsp. vesca]|uniref:putative disease resistance protein RGA4 n=1 Tax=Fragaria vesca subsp. vesca TaxID=101020 RepID=UPI0002C2F861|nr:PREDICTED: putative disease resistance protein RGA4 [Fragaria vesca subsp. vesca]XP_011464783.1 PREDICTED: putative disease resistance protein RGA4 [Fragaria vesca subsp. vesca]